MKKKGLLIGLLALIIAGGTFAATLAFFTDSKTQTNTFTIGNVSIGLTEPEFSKNGSNENGDYEIKNVMPNAEIVKDPTISVLDDSQPAYIRAKITYSGITNEAQITELENNIEFKTGWKKGTDGYYYFNQKVEPGTSQLVFDKVTIPSNWNSDTLPAEFSIIVLAEAIQADNFTPTTENVTGTTFITGWPQ